jgi:hypothetical protein
MALYELTDEQRDYLVGGITGGVNSVGEPFIGSLHLVDKVGMIVQTSVAKTRLEAIKFLQDIRDSLSV